MAHSAAFEARTGLGAGTLPRLRTPRGVLLGVRTLLRRPFLDGEIACGIERPGDRAFARRKAQLVGARERKRLASRFEEILAAGPARPALSSAVAVDHEAVAVARPVLTELILSLRSSEAVEARGVVLAWRLLTDAASPVYGPLGGRPADRDRLWDESLSLLVALRPSIERWSHPRDRDGAGLPASLNDQRAFRGARAGAAEAPGVARGSPRGRLS